MPGQAKLTHCKRGHEFTPENSYYSPKDGFKSCRTCKKEWAVAHPPTKEQKRITAARWRAKNPDWHKNESLVRKYNVTLAQFEDMRKAQDGKCAICAREMDKANLDHDHDTGAIRGLLCTGCNTGIGALREDESTLFGAVAYLRKYKRPILVSREVA